MRTIGADAIKGDLPPDTVLLDVRSAMEHAESCLQARHLHIALERLDPESLAAQLPGGKASPVLILCRAGGRARKVAALLEGAGFSDVAIVEGGLESCVRCGVSLQSGGAGLSLERQVRIAAGILIVLGGVAALSLDRAFIAVPIAIGCGLIIAGVTNRCGLALLLTRAPWNRRG